jgi:hypothetical protein
MHRMLFWEYKIPDYLNERKNIVRHVLFTAIFALVFINLYAPFGVETWYNVTRPELFLYSSMVILTGVLVIAISRIIMYQVTRRKDLNYSQYIIWIAAEILCMALVYVVLEKLIVKDPRDILTTFKVSLTTTCLVLLIPYTITWLFFSWIDKNRVLEALSANSTGTPVKVSGPAMIPFHDEKGELRFSLKTAELLYLEAADNYVIIHYLDHGRKMKYMIRNTLKNMEGILRDADVIRCHRSYMVNFERVKIIRKERDGLVLELDLPEKELLPISKTYVEQIMKIFSGYTSGD